MDLLHVLEGLLGEVQGVPGDATGDGFVNFDDVLAVLAAWGPCEGDCPEEYLYGHGPEHEGGGDEGAKCTHRTAATDSPRSAIVQDRCPRSPAPSWAPGSLPAPAAVIPTPAAVVLAQDTPSLFSKHSI